MKIIECKKLGARSAKKKKSYAKRDYVSAGVGGRPKAAGPCLVFDNSLPVYLQHLRKTSLPNIIMSDDLWKVPSKSTHSFGL